MEGAWLLVRVPAPVLFLARIGASFGRVIVQFWRETLAAQEALLGVQRSSEREGSLRWQRTLSGRRLVGSYPPAEAPRLTDSRHP